MEEVALLECLLSAGCWTEARKFEAGLFPSPTCPRCGAERSCMQHSLYECPVVNSSENPDIQATNSLCARASLEASAWPCLWLRWLFPVGYAPVAPVGRFVSVTMFGVDAPPLDKWPGGRYFIDGLGGKWSEFNRVRRCGACAVQAELVHGLSSFKWGAVFSLPGGVQSATRVDLFAWVMVCQRVADTHVEFVSDSFVNVEFARCFLARAASTVWIMPTWIFGGPSPFS